MADQPKELNIYQKIVLIRESIGTLYKDVVKKELKYKYTSGAQILEKMQPKMNELNVLLMPSMGEKPNHAQIIGKYKDGGEWYKYLYSNDMTYTWVNGDNPDDRIVSHWDAIGIQDDPSKAFGSAVTYAERYFLLKFLGIPTDDEDPDNDKNDPKPGISKTVEKKETPKLIQPDQIAIFKSQYPGDLWTKFLEKNKLQKIEEMDYELAKGKIDNLNKLKDEERAKKEAQNANT